MPRRVWFARVTATAVRGGPPLPPSQPAGLEKLARDAADAADASARSAAAAAHVASMAPSLAGRLETALPRARSTTTDLANSALTAFDAAAVAEERARLAQLAAEFDPPRPERGQPPATRPPADPSLRGT